MIDKMKPKLYTLKTCSTCRNAIRFLKERAIAFDEIAIREQAPTQVELHALLDSKSGEIRRLFNTSGGDYKAMGMKDRLLEITKADAIKLLATHGNLVKRPVYVDGNVTLNGFNEAEWRAAFGESNQ